VSIERERATLPAAGVAAVAAWVNSFLAEAGTLVDKAGRIRVRLATRMMETDLDKLGFYAALEGPSS